MCQALFEAMGIKYLTKENLCSHLAQTLGGKGRQERSEHGMLGTAEH